MNVNKRTKKRKIKNEINYTLNTIYSSTSNDTIFQEISPSVNFTINDSLLNIETNASFSTVPRVLPTQIF